MNEVIGIPPYLVADPRCVLYLRGDAINGSTRIKDWSPSHKTVTVNGNTCNSTTQTKFPPTSIYFDGTGGYLTIASNTDFNLGSGNFTVSLWYYPTGLTGNHGILGFGDTNDDRISIGTYADNRWDVITKFGGGTTYEVYPTSPTVVLNTWQQVVFTRSGNKFTVYIDGSEIGNYTAAISVTNGLPVYPGYAHAGGAGTYAQGNIDELAIWKGVAIPIEMLYPQKQRMIV